MTIVAADWQAYALPLRRPWRSSQGDINERHGKLLRLQDDVGRIGWGDCAPLPEFGIGEAAATAFAEETALLDLAAQKAGLPLNTWLSGEAAVQNIAVNSILGAVFDVTPTDLSATIEKGFRVLKLKVGTGPWSEEIIQLHKLAAASKGQVQFRVDANKAWTMRDAWAFLDACRDLPIESLEEPLTNPTPEALAKLQAITRFPLAIDESVELINNHFFRAPPVRRLIIKPARFGGLLKSMAIGLQARAAGIECVVTSSLESNCGLLACAHLAAAIAPQGTHGLATAEWFTGNTGKTDLIDRGVLPLSSQAGLGFQQTPER